MVASGLAKRCLVQISYAIGVAQPLSVHVDTYGTGTKPDKQILASVLKAFDFRPGEILITTGRVAPHTRTWQAQAGQRACGCLCLW